MERARVLRFLRYAVTALSLMACVLLIALWVRSYWWSDHFHVSVPMRNVLTIHSMYGTTDWYVKSSKVSHVWAIESNTVARETEGLAGVPGPWLQKLFFFRLHRRVLSFPHWVLVLLFAIFATAPWLRWSKRFSLRTLLIATTLVGVGMGTVIYLAG